MFNITSDRDITWPSFVLSAGPNTFRSRRLVPTEVWPKLARFRELGLVQFDGGADDRHDDAKFEEFTETQLFAMSRPELAELAAATGALVASGGSKAALLAAMEGKRS